MLNSPALAGKKILVTGAGGFLGQHLLAELNASGAAITALIHNSAPRSLPDGTCLIRADCGNAAEVAKAAAGQDIIIHMAGLLFGATWQDYLRANQGFAANIAQAALQGGQRVVFVSSLAAAGPCALPPGKSEKDPTGPVSAYGWSKLLAEQTLAAALGNRLAILRPPIIYGSRDRGLLPLFKSCRRGLGVSPGLRPFPVSLIHASDAARAIILLCRPEAQGIYHLEDGEVYEMGDLCRAIGKAQGRKKVMILRAPLFLMGLSASLGQAASRIWQQARSAFGAAPARPPAWNPDKFREARQAGWLANGKRLRQELGFAPAMDLAAGLAETIQGYQEDGWL